MPEFSPFQLNAKVLMVPHKRQSSETLSPDQVSWYSPYTYYAAAVKCESSKSWTCGGAYSVLRVGPLAPASTGIGILIPDGRFLTCRFRSPVNCDNNPNFQLLAGGGDGNVVQRCAYIHNLWADFIICMPIRSTGYVGYDPIHDTAIVAHQGTNKTQMQVD